MKHCFFLMVLLFILLSHSGMAQNSELVHFRFEVADKSTINHISTLVSIDRLEGKTVYAYANQKEFQSFLQLGIAYKIMEESRSTKSIVMATTMAEMALWNKYPTYEVYVQMMQKYAADYPNNCKLVEIGTLSSGRKLLALKISDNINQTEAEPQLFFTSTMHGDEMGGFIVLLRLIDHLLVNYVGNTNFEITRMINGSVIWINPLANPDGTYKGGNHTVAGAIRTNANYVDLNRNFPDPAAGSHPDGNSYQQENQLMMAFADSIPFNLSVNIHSGEEVVNYPWDTWSAPTADDLWWKYVGGNYRDSAQANGPPGYFDGVSDGLSNGYDWYRITGGRQDYMNYFKRCREFTLEITNTDFYPSASLPNLWNYNRGALLGYMAEGLNGVQGTVANSLGAPLNAVITVLNHDLTNSEVYSHAANGYFARYLKSGNYTFRISSAGYFDSIVPNITITDGMATPLHIKLNKQQGKLCLSSDSISIELIQNESTSTKLLLKNCGNYPYAYKLKTDPDSLPNWLSVNKPENSIAAGATDTLFLTINTHSLKLGTYNASIIIQADESTNIPITLNVIPVIPITAIPEKFQFRTITNQSVLDTVWLLNETSSLKKVTAYSESSWLNLSGSTYEIHPQDSLPVMISIPKEGLRTGFYKSNIIVTGEARAKIGVELTVDTIPIIKLVQVPKPKEILLHTNSLDTIWITNWGGGKAVSTVTSSTSWIQPAIGTLEVESGETVPLKLILATQFLEKGTHSGTVTFASENNIVTSTIQIYIDTLPELSLNKSNIAVIANQDAILTDSLLLMNQGGDTLHYEISKNATDDWLAIYPLNGYIASGKIQQVKLAFNTRTVKAGNYNTELLVNNSKVSITLQVNENPQLELNKNGFYVSLVQGQFATDSLLISNTGSKTTVYSLKISDQSNQNWVELDSHSGSIPAGDTKTIVLSFAAHELKQGIYRTHLEIDDGKIIRIPIVMEVLLPAK